MVILHIAYVHGNPYSGVVRAVPQHVMAQQSLEQVAYINITNIADSRIERQFSYNPKLQIAALPKPFNHPDVVVFHEVYHREFLRFAEELRGLGIPYVTVPHGCLTHEAQSKKRWKKAAANWLLFNRFVKGSAALHYLTEGERKHSVPNRPSFVVENGVVLPAVQKEAFHADQVHFVFIGRVDIHTKGLDILLDAVREIQDELAANNCSFSLYGPSFQDSVERVKALIAKNGIGHLVSIYPPVSGAEKEKILLDADVFVQTSRYEGLPLGILEALSYGLPCIVTQGTNMKELMESNHAGWGAATEAKSIADAICRFISEKNRWQEKSQNARKLIEDEFAWPTVAKRTIDRYRELIDSNFQI